MSPGRGRDKGASRVWGIWSLPGRSKHTTESAPREERESQAWTHQRTGTVGREAGRAVGTAKRWKHGLHYRIEGARSPRESSAGTQLGELDSELGEETDRTT